MSSRAHAEYFPGIDGLRAVAVLSVLLFHLNVWLPAGFVGVDVFFVISGFVVASAAADLPSGRFRDFVASFYVRRVVRIAPALIACLLVTMLVMALVIPVSPDGRLTEANTKTGLAAFLGFSNIVLAGASSDYWSPSAELNPFTHTWSLAVEEQFYLLFPFLYFLWLRGFRRAAVVALSVLMVCSVGVAILWDDKGPIAFYSLASRFWELGAGVALFFSRDRWRPLLASAPASVRETLALVAAFALGASLLWTDSKSFPWPWAMLPVGATALLIAVSVATPQSWVSRGLASRPLVAVGKISYSLYLWHWPLIVFCRWTLGMESTVERLIVGVLAFAFALASYRWIEQPMRRSVTVRSFPRWKLLTLASAGVAVAGSMAVGVALLRTDISLSVSSDPLVWRWDGVLPGAQPGCSSTRTISGLAGGSVIDLRPQGCPPSDRRIYVAGDSHAGAYLAMLDSYARERGATVRLFTKPGCSVFRLRTPLSSAAMDCQRFVQAVLTDVQRTARAGDALFLPGLRVPRYTDQWGPGGLSSANEMSDDAAFAIDEAVAQLSPLSAAGVHVVFEAPKPVFKSPPFRCSDAFNRANPVCQQGFDVPRSELEERRAAVLARMSLVVERLPAATIWDPLPVLCPLQTCSAYEAGSRQPLFFDGDHISGLANQRLAGSFSRAMDFGR